MTPPPVYAATGAYGLMGRGLLEKIPDLIVLSRSPRPTDISRFVPALPLPSVDVAEKHEIAAALKKIGDYASGRPIVLFHLAALTDTKNSDGKIFDRVNFQGTRNVVEGASNIGAYLVHASTDYVFEAEGRTDAPYTENDRPSKRPAGAYSASKFDAENFVIGEGDPSRTVVARIAFPYGGSGPRPGLAEKMAARFAEARRNKSAVALFRDQKITPAPVFDIIPALRRISDVILAGVVPGRRVFHVVGGVTTPLEFGGWVRKVIGYEDVRVDSVSVTGTGYCPNLWLSNDDTSKILGWKPSPHIDALNKIGPSLLL